MTWSTIPGSSSPVFEPSICGWKTLRLKSSSLSSRMAERHVSRQLRFAYLAPGVLKRLVYKREVPAVTLLKLTDVAALPWHEQPERVFD